MQTKTKIAGFLFFVLLLFNQASAVCNESCPDPVWENTSAVLDSVGVCLPTYLQEYNYSWVQFDSAECEFCSNTTFTESNYSYCHYIQPLNISPERDTGNQLINWLFNNLWLIVALCVGLCMLYYCVRTFSQEIRR
jgi:hypothetical protein